MCKPLRPLGFVLLSLALASCRVVYVADVQQGNILDKKTVDQLQPGMTKHQVLVLMGSPSVTTPFDQDRWDYVATQQHRGGPITTRTFTLTFNNDTLVRTEGNFFATDASKLLQQTKKYKVDYPVDETQGDKSSSPDDSKDSSGGFGSGTSSSDSSGK